MAPTNDNERPNTNEKVLHVWSKPIEEGDQVPGLQGSDKNPDGTPRTSRSPLSEAVSMIKREDFTNVANTPCARQGLLTGIGAGAGLGGLKFVIQGNATKSANWAVGFFILGSIASYEYCQYQRRAEKIQMKRHIEVVTQNRKEQAKKIAEERREQQRIEEEQKARDRAWYKFW
ncbi:cox20 fam36a [Trichoderma arundinaceum]|uniref:Cytochrome c oxidase assembly protein COX20, mitochondrial n=1 Tax=Trichoderma arundinaceum TaxID=490622 RepID=A0A395NWA4_TRIAR|nr:cox20 fam36a [Trichoderma arundinaceum]